MAQLTQADQRQMKARGLYVKERCDRAGCTSIIGYLSWLGRSHAVFCSRECRDLEEPMMRVKVREPKEPPAEQIVKAKSDMVLGIARPGTMPEKMLSVMLDEKWHVKDSFKKYKNRAKDSVGYFLTVLGRTGMKAERPFKLEMDGDKVRLVFLGKNCSVQKVVVQDVPVAEA